jgi:hypothetical protein
MAKNITSAPRRFKRLSVELRNLPLAVLVVVISICIEVYATGGIFQQNTASVSIFGLGVALAPVEAAISLGLGLLSLWCAMTAAALRADPRSDQKARAFGAQALAFVLLCAPIYYAGNSFAFQRQLADYREYSGSEAERADRMLAFDDGADSRARGDAAESLKNGVEPQAARFDFLCTLWAAFLYVVNMAAARLGWRPRPETDAEAKAREAAVRAAKAAQTRERNKKAADKARRQAERDAARKAGRGFLRVV